MFAYIVSGLRVSSDLMLPGLIEAGEAGGGFHDGGPRGGGVGGCGGGCRDGGAVGGADVVIRAGVVATDLAGAVAGGPNWQIAEGRFLLIVPGIIRLLLSGGDTIVYALDEEGAGGSGPAGGPGGDLADGAVFVSGTGFGILLHQRGRIVLHASAVRMRDDAGAVLFCGPSGAGKSTLAAALGAAGHALLADDFCGVAIDAAGVPMVYPDGRQLKLWENAIDRLALADRRGGPVRSRLRKYYVDPHATTARPLPIAAVYVLREARPPQIAGIAPANLVDAALLLQHNAYRPAMIARMGQTRLYFEAATAIARHAGVFTLTREMDFADLPRVIASLTAHWGGGGGPAPARIAGDRLLDAEPVR